MNLRIITFILIIGLFFSACKNAEKVTEKPVAVIADKTNNDIVHLETPAGEYTNLETIIKQNKGKVIYIDYWASWCRPCRAMMPASAKLKELYKGKDVVFIYVSVDKKREQWETANKQEGFIDNTYIATNYPKAKLFQLRNVNRIPRYMLYDKTGRIIDDESRRPNDPDLMITIDGLLTM